MISQIRRVLRFWRIGAETFERLVPESEAMGARIVGEILAGEFQRAERLGSETPPRWIRHHVGFARVAADIRTACKARRLGMFVKSPHAAIIADIAHHLGIHPRGDSEEVFSNCLDKATEAESWSFAPAAILFWIAHVAERDLMGDDLPAKADENAFNGRLLTALMSAAKKEGRLLAYVGWQLNVRMQTLFSRLAVYLRFGGSEISLNSTAAVDLVDDPISH